MKTSKTSCGTCHITGILLLCLLLPAVIRAAEQGPVELLQETRDKVLAIVDADPGVLEDTERLREIAYEYLLPHVDFITLSRWVIGKYWRTATAEQREVFASEFRELLLNNYLQSVTRYRDNVITFMPLRDVDANRKVVVHGVVDQPGGPAVHVNFRMHNSEGNWLVYDVVVEGISLAVTHRSTFSRQIREVGIEGVIAKLESHNARAMQKQEAVAEQPAATTD
ncbi:MAG: ABC transporter substrate-binding protein [Pseudomonadota bacterium]